MIQTVINNLNINGKRYTLWHVMPHATLKHNVVCSILLATPMQVLCTLAHVLDSIVFGSLDHGPKS